MAQLPVLIDLDPALADSMPCCGIKNSAHEGRRRKNCWLQENCKAGLRARVLVEPDQRPCGYIEYLPGESAWRGVDARGYLFIHCIWTFSKRHQKLGLGSSMVKACIEDAKQAGMHGVAVMVRDGPWMAGSALYQANGFRVVDTAPPDYQLLVRKLNPSAPDPSFRGGWEEKQKQYSRGMTIIRCDQCPHIAKFANDIARLAAEEYGIKPRIVEWKTCQEAQNAPTPYAVFAVIHNGRVLADHPISGTRFRNIMRKLQ